MVSQAIEGYLCSCGEKILGKKEFQKHLLRRSREEGKGTHVSMGRVNMDTGEVTMPPWEQRTDEQKQRSVFGRKSIPTSGKDGGKDGGGRKDVPARTTDILAHATQLRLVPRVFTCDYTPVMRAAQVAASEVWKWPDMPFEDFVDTILNMFFKSRGIILTGYIIQEGAEVFTEQESTEKVQESKVQEKEATSVS